MSDTGYIQYFGFGANASLEMIKAIVGDDFVGIGVEKEIYGYELCYKKLEHIEINTMAWEVLKRGWEDKGKPFISYFIRKKIKSDGSVDEDAKVCGVLWSLTEEQYSKIRNWELVSQHEGETNFEMLIEQRIKGSLPSGQGMQYDKEVHDQIVSQVLYKNSEKALPLEPEMIITEWPYYKKFIEEGGFKEHILEAARQARIEFESNK